MSKKISRTLDPDTLWGRRSGGFAVCFWASLPPASLPQARGTKGAWPNFFRHLRRRGRTRRRFSILSCVRVRVRACHMLISLPHACLAGGLFRDCISHMCADLQSNWVPLFIPCPNAKGFGENQDKWIPNPLSLNSLQLSMYAFVGKLMGIAIRGKHILNLDLPSIIWKQLVLFLALQCARDIFKRLRI